MYSAVFVIVGVVVQFLVAESKQGRYDNISVNATCFIDANSTTEFEYRDFNYTIHNSNNLTGNLPLQRLICHKVNVKLPVLYKNSFSGLRSLFLSLYYSLTEIKPYAFNNTVVHTLDLGFNYDLRKIQKHTFFNMSAHVLRMDYNGIRYIEPGAFEGIVLQSQADHCISRLDNCLSITELDHTKRLYMLNLKVNKLERIQAGVFNNVNVERIELSFNKIRVLEPNAFTQMNSLKWLSLEANQIVSITKNVFQSETLVELLLDLNRIEFIEPESFGRLPRIEIINLRGNNLKEIRRGIFSNLSVKDLDLSRNKIKYIEERAFADLPNLEQLNIQDNRLTSLDENMFSNIPKMKHIGVNFNATVSTSLEQYIQSEAVESSRFNNK